MKNKPIILVNEGCSMSTFTSDVVRCLIIHHGIQMDIPADNEMYVFSKNPYYEEGMNVFDLLEKTLKEEPSICFKLPLRFLKQETLLSLLKQNGAKFCFIERFNFLDTAICNIKDFKNKSERDNSLDGVFNFVKWRKSKVRLEKKVDPSSLISDIKTIHKGQEAKTKIMQEITDQKELIYAEDLCRLNIDAYEKVFKILGYKMDKNLTKEFLKKYEIKDPYKHADVIDCPDIDAFKNELKDNGYFHFWRE
jgi:hypothetical protein